MWCTTAGFPGRGSIALILRSSFHPVSTTNIWYSTTPLAGTSSGFADMYRTSAGLTHY
jgi:hypothetical protein